MDIMQVRAKISPEFDCAVPRVECKSASICQYYSPYPVKQITVFPWESYVVDQTVQKVVSQNSALKRSETFLFSRERSLCIINFNNSKRSFRPMPKFRVSSFSGPDF